MKLFERFAAAWAIIVGSEELAATDGKPELTEENVASLEAAATEIKDVRAANATLKDEPATAAQNIADLEASIQLAKEQKDAAKADLDKIGAALKANNVELGEDDNAIDVAVEKINAWGKGTGAPTATTTTTADDLGESSTNAFHSEADEELAAARASLGYITK